MSPQPFEAQMTLGLRPPWLVLLLGCLALAPARAGEAENLQRLQSLPRAQRLRLSENLDRFDRLDAAQRQAVRQLDELLAELPATERQRYLELMHRYHLWVQGLGPAQRKELQAAPAEKRLELIRRLRAAQRRAQETDRRIDAIWARSAAFNPYSLFEVAHLIRVWMRLTPPEQAALERLDFPARVQRLKQLGQDRGISSGPPVMRPELEALRRQIESGQPVQNGLLARKELEDLRRHAEAITGLKGPAAFQKAQVRAAVIRRLEANYFRTYEPEPVEARRLSRFEEALPAWLDELIDPLPPEVARRRLTILYRLVFPHPAELPEPDPKSPVPKPEAPASSSPSPPSTPPPPGPSPF